MRKPLLVAMVLAILALDWAALDDITTGTEPDVRLEWAFVIVSVPLLAGLARLARRRPRQA